MVLAADQDNGDMNGHVCMQELGKIWKGSQRLGRFIWGTIHTRLCSNIFKQILPLPSLSWPTALCVRKGMPRLDHRNRDQTPTITCNHCPWLRHMQASLCRPQQKLQVTTNFWPGLSLWGHACFVSLVLLCRKSNKILSSYFLFLYLFRRLSLALLIFTWIPI